MSKCKWHYAIWFNECKGAVYRFKTAERRNEWLERFYADQQPESTATAHATDETGTIAGSCRIKPFWPDSDSECYIEFRISIHSERLVAP